MAGGGNGYGPGGPNGPYTQAPAPTQAPPAPPAVNLGGFKALLPEVRAQLLAQAQQYGDIANGSADPRFQAYQDAQMRQLQMSQNADLASADANLARRGLGGSTVGMNVDNGINANYANQRGTLVGGLGLQQMQRQDAALGQQGSVLNDALQNELAIPGIQVAQLAAENSGKNTGGGGGLCCFIVLEATDGILPDVIRRYRDEQCTPRKRRGYYRLAEVLVPAMKHNRWAKQAIRWGMVKPLTAYGRWYYGESHWGWLASPAKWLWLGLFSLLGSGGKFVRSNGEVI